MNFVVLWLFAKVFFVKFGSITSFGAVQVNNLRKFSPQNSKFSPSQVSRYTVHWLKIHYPRGGKVYYCKGSATYITISNLECFVSHSGKKPK